MLFNVLFTILAAAHHNKKSTVQDIDCTIDPDFCGANSVSEPIRSCTRGFQYDHNQGCCTSEIVYEPLLRCKYGGTPFSDGSCHSLSNPQITCGDGFKYDRQYNTCVNTELAPMIPTCSHRSDVDGSLTEDGRKCMYFKEVPSRLSCPAGSKLKDGVCIQYQSLHHDNLNFTCPDGWDLDIENQECVLVERVDCNRVKHNKSICKSSNHKQCEVEDFQPCNSGCVIEDEHRKLCDHCKEKVKPEHICQVASCKMAVKDREVKEKSFVEAVSCDRVTIIPAKPLCIDGSYNRIKKSCCTETTFEPDVICKTYGPSQKCVKSLFYLSDYVCPAPFEVSCGGRSPKSTGPDSLVHPSNCECVRITFSDVLQTCPDDLIYDATQEKCVDITQAIPYCPEKNSDLIDGFCHRVENEPSRLEYNVTYVTEEPCKLDECIKNKVPIVKRKVKHNQVKVNKGKVSTKCNEVQCTNKFGAPVIESNNMVYVDCDNSDMF